MNSKQLFDKTAPNENMPDDIFNQLMQNLVFEKGNGITNFSFSAKLNFYELVFYIDNNSNNVMVDDFGFMTASKEWIELIPTYEQIAIMQSIINDEIVNWQYDI